MALIKHNQAVDIARSAVVLDLGDLQRQGSLIIQAARDQAAAIIAEARAERERIVAGAAESGRAAGFEQGKTSGLAAGLEEGRKAAIDEARPRLEKLDASWTAALASFESTRSSMLHAAERDVIRLSLLIAERIVKRKIDADSSIVVEQLHAVLTAVARPTSLLVRIHPDDAPILAQAMPALTAQSAMVKHIEIAHDPTLERGSCIADMRGAHDKAGAESPSVVGGEIDASIATQLLRIAESLLPGGAPIENRAPDDRS